MSNGFYIKYFFGQSPCYGEVQSVFRVESLHRRQRYCHQRNYTLVFVLDPPLDKPFAVSFSSDQGWPLGVVVATTSLVLIVVSLLLRIPRPFIALASELDDVNVCTIAFSFTLCCGAMPQYLITKLGDSKNCIHRHYQTVTRYRFAVQVDGTGLSE